MKTNVHGKILLTVGALFYALVIPYLEINSSHVFNSSWPPHARFHEVWQLFTNITLGGLVVWLSWYKNAFQLAGLLSISVMGGVLFAHITEAIYGGSILSGNITRVILGLDLAAFVALLVIILSALAMYLTREPKR